MLPRDSAGAGRATIASRLEVPHVDPIGLIEQPAGFDTRPRRYPRSTRALAAVLLVAFAAVASATTAWSLGGWCLTSQASALRVHPPVPRASPD